MKENKDTEFVFEERKDWKECLPGNFQTSIGLCADRKNADLSEMVEKSRIKILLEISRPKLGEILV